MGVAAGSTNGYFECRRVDVGAGGAWGEVEAAITCIGQGSIFRWNSG